MLQRLIRPLVYSIFFGIALYIAMIVISGYDDIKTAFSRVSLFGLLLIFGLSLLNYSLRFVRWHWYLNRLGHNLPVGRNFIYYLAGFSLTTTPGKAGEAIRSIYLKRHGMSLTDSLAALFVERFSDLLSIILLAIFAVIHFGDYQNIEIAIGIVVLSMLAVLRSPRMIGFLQRTLITITPRTLHTLIENMFGLIRSSSALLGSRILIGSLCIGIVSWGAEGVALYYLLDMLEISVSIWLGIGIYAISILVGAISFIPGGLGSTEAVMGLLIISAGASQVDAVTATVICRVATLWFAVALGLIALSWLEIKEPRLTRKGVDLTNKIIAEDTH